MSRSAKKFLYALLYLGIFSLAGLSFYGLGRLRGLESTASPSIPARPSPSASIQILEQQIFRISESPSAFLFGKVKNTSSEYGFRFRYSFLLYGAGGEELLQSSGEASIAPASETRISRTEPALSSRDVESVSLQIQNVEVTPAHEFPELSFSFSREPYVEILESERAMRVRGAVRNESGTLFPEVRAVAVLRDSFGFQAFVSGTILSNLRSFSEKSFEIQVPYDAALLRAAREGGVEVYFYPVF